MCVPGIWYAFFEIERIGEVYMVNRCLLLFGYLISLLCCVTSYSKTLIFSNLIWEAQDRFGKIGPNHWSSNNVWVDSNGWLHLKITNINNTWYCPEISTTTKFGFGQYWFYTIGRLDALDPNVVLGLFNYPSKDTGIDETNEIDIEFSKWGSKNPKAANISYTVWPAILEPNKTVLSYTIKLDGDHSTHGFIWKKDSIIYQSGFGHYKDYRYPIFSWLFSPPDFEDRIPQQPLPLHINLWLVEGKPPLDKKEVELIIKKFCFKSMDGTQSNCEGNKVNT